MDKFNQCNTPFTKCWCEAVPGRMNNPNCQSLIPEVSIQSDMLTFVIVTGILFYMLWIFKINQYDNIRQITNNIGNNSNINFNIFWIMSEFKNYRRSQIAEIREVTQEDIDQYNSKDYISIFGWQHVVSISSVDKESGSPKIGDMIARNPINNNDQWLIAEQYFKDNFESY